MEDDWLPAVLELRPRTRWEDVVVAINAQKRGLFSVEALKRAVKLYVAKGKLPASVLGTAPRREIDIGTLEAVAEIAADRPGATLQEIGDALEQMGIRTPRGGSRWHPSSVHNVKMRAERLGLLAA